MLPTFMTKKAIPLKPAPPPSGRVERVVLAHLTDNLRPFWFKVGTIEGSATGEQVLVKFGETLVHVPTEWLEPADT